MLAGMHRLLLAFAPALIAFAVPAHAEDRSFLVTNFDRVRVDGPFEVHVAVGGGVYGARASGEGKAIDALDITVQGSTLIVRRSNRGWGEQGKSDAPTPIVYVSVPSLLGGGVIGGGKLRIEGKVQSPRLDFQLTGVGAIDARGIEAQDVNVTLIGNGAVALAGRSLHARLTTNGNGAISAGGLDVGDLIVRLDGPGATEASARYTADLFTAGLGSIAVAGSPKCTVRAPAGGPVSCGATNP